MKSVITNIVSTTDAFGNIVTINGQCDAEAYLASVEEPREIFYGENKENSFFSMSLRVGAIGAPSALYVSIAGEPDVLARKFETLKALQEKAAGKRISVANMAVSGRLRSTEKGINTAWSLADAVIADTEGISQDVVFSGFDG